MGVFSRDWGTFKKDLPIKQMFAFFLKGWYTIDHLVFEQIFDDSIDAEEKFF